MLRYIRIYKKLLELNYATLLAYKANFINSLISSLGWGLFSLYTMYLLTFKVSSVYGWTKYELLLIAAVYNIVVGTFHVFFSRNFDRFSTVIHFGQLDSILIKPIDSQFLISLWHFNYTGILRILLGIGFSAYIFSIMGVSLHFLTLLLFCVLVLCGILILYSVWFIISTIIIWQTGLSNLVSLLYELNTVSRYPQEFFKGTPLLLFVLVFPLTLVIAVPIRAVLLKVSFLDIGMFVGIGGLLLFASRKFWKFSLRFYTSASG